MTAGWPGTDVEAGSQTEEQHRHACPNSSFFHRLPPAAPADGLWWLGSGRAVNALRRLVLLASLAVFLLAVEER